MNLHEYQAKELLTRFGVPIPRGIMAETVAEARKAAKTLGGERWMVKAQIHAGGRGKAGGVRSAGSPEEVAAQAATMLGMPLVTEQTGPEGAVVRRVLIEAATPHQAEYYLALTLDRNREMPTVLASVEGGMDIESSTGGIRRVEIDPLIGFRPYHARLIASDLHMPHAAIPAFSSIIGSLYRLYRKTDASLIEINPLGLLDDHTFIALDAKVALDDNALYRQPECRLLYDPAEEPASEIEARRFNLSYVKMDGNIGCMVNGAGLALATMDLIRLEGGYPANFLDVGGGANAATVAKGLEIILQDPCVKAIFVNIFGGIVRCDRIAEGIIEATRRIDVHVPLVVRLEGTNAERAMELLSSAELPNLVPVGSLVDGARMVAAVTDLECCRGYPRSS